ncbi:MAG: potassium-transporting ATPase subunit KdpC [Candidatus Sericytochromatia bacterium]
MIKIAFSALRITIVMVVLTGVVYPVSVWGIGQALFKEQANGSIIYKDNKAVGSLLIAQKFESDKYFHSRPSAIDYGQTSEEDYKKGNYIYNSGGSNWGPSNKKLIDRIGEDIKKLKKENPNQKIPLDMVTTSSSGLDPDITVDSAIWQIERISKARNISTDKLKELIEKNTQNPFLGFNGEKRVNVLKMNLELDELKS